MYQVDKKKRIDKKRVHHEKKEPTLFVGILAAHQENLTNKERQE